ncbi:F0F1 ATP synthase subunit A [Mucilaginibacter segetis]|uniref:F0F1 ATP synthase subunit A n=1 Tax=Mucilaginibacter segetis TaxID=2793071 RepID=UPI00293D9B83|nr:F0F1 ATP synthase subunit A [Mucilaginibacter segetis]
MKSKIFTLLRICAVFLTLAAFSTSAFSQEEHAEGTGEKFETSKVVLEHIADSHSLHIIGHTHLPLPVIVYTSKGLEMFSSAKFADEAGGHEEEGIYHGSNYNYKLVNDKVKIVNNAGEIDEAATSGLYDFSITKNVVSMWMSVILLLIIFISVSSSYKKRAGKAPKGLQAFVEPLIVFVRDDIARPNIGYKHQRFMPLLLTVFFFIWINNLIGLVPFFPGGANLTGNIAVTLVLSVITLIVVNLNGNKHYWSHIFIPADVPVWIWPLWWVIELVGIISKPFALMIRLFANITAGHIIVLSLISLIFVFQSFAIAPVSIAFVVFMDVLELLVAALQAFIFTLLTALFIGTAIEEHHH